MADNLESVRLFSVLKMQGGVEGFPLQLMEEKLLEMISAAASAKIHVDLIMQCRNNVVTSLVVLSESVDLSNRTANVCAAF